VVGRPGCRRLVLARGRPADPVQPALGGFRRVLGVLGPQVGCPGFFALFGGVFVVIGVYFVVLRFFVGHYRRRTTSYFLTSNRAIIVGPRSMKSTRVDAQTLSSTWTRDRRRITVNFGFPDSANLRRTFGRTSMSMSAMMGPLTGWDPFQINPVPILFQDVTDVVGLDDALRQVASFSA
jgi:hypothetical protein